MIKKTRRIICIFIIILLQCLTVIFWGTKKERFNVDEVFSYEGAKSGGYGQQYWDKDVETFYGKNYTRRDFEEHITIYTEDLLIQKPLELADALMHRNVYYTILNLAATFTAGKLTKWTGIGLNLLFFILTQIILYRYTFKMCNNSYRSASLVILLYGFSAGGISTVLYMRCYMMLILVLLLVCCCYTKFIESTYWKYKFLYLVFALVGGWWCIRIHQFGMLAFMIMTCGMIFYLLISQRNRQLLFGVVVVAVVGGFICIPHIRKSSGLVEMFKGNAGGIVINGELALRGKYLFEIISNHLCYHSIMLSLIVILVLFSFIKQKKVREEVEKQRKIGIIFCLCICSYLAILIFGRALAWKYACIMYPFIYLMIIMILNIQGISKQAFTVIFVAMFGITGISYYGNNISELFLGEMKAEKFFEENYGDINGVMIHADGSGENWLYEAAYLWPDNVEINVQLLSEIINASWIEIPQNNDDEILLWLTIDYDNSEVIELFMKKTPFTQCEMIYSTDALDVYICRKQMLRESL